MLTTVIEVFNRDTADAYRLYLITVRRTNQAKTAPVGDKSQRSNDLPPLTIPSLHAYMGSLSFDAAPVAQLDRASVYGTEGWGFEPLQAYISNPRHSGSAPKRVVASVSLEETLHR